ncbi:MAG: PaaI family thioesterase [Gemmatimonadales bacterium]|nr:PaaI family thioesterase [Gemmatimonadales bacterium]
MQSPGRRLLTLWNRLSPWPGGQWLFARIFGRMVPYSGSVGPRIRVLEPGHARVEIPDRRSNRQHLGSVHAIALLNVAEMTSGLAMMAGLPDGVRGIVTSISMEYLKKARGTITAVARVEVPTVTADTDFDVTADCLDPEGTVVARARVRWRLGPVREKRPANSGVSTHAVNA